MGLDMYLTANRHVGGWEHVEAPEKKLFSQLGKLTGIAPDDGCPSFQLRATVGYWRKANAIHGWFVKYVQDGVDECQESYVTREQLAELRVACKQVLDTVETVPGRIKEGTTYHADGRIEHHSRVGPVVAQAGIAAEVLPTQSGFLFGGTDYDEYYLTDLRETVAIIDRVLNDPIFKDWEFYYRASW